MTHVLKLKERVLISLWYGPFPRQISLQALRLADYDDEALLWNPVVPGEGRSAGTQDRAFSVMAPWLWNSLPKEARLVGFHRKAE